MTASFTPMQLQSLLHDFVSEHGVETEAAREWLLAFEEDDDLEALAKLRSLFHKVAGVAPSIGLRAAGTVAAMGEELVAMVTSGKLLPGREVKAMIARAVLELAETVAEVNEAPQASETPMPALERPERSAAELASAPKVLIVDDDPLSAKLMERCMQNAGIQTRHCRDPLQATAALEAESPDLILLDLMMPGQDGFETCRQLRAHASSDRIPIIFITRLTQVDDKVQALKQGADDYITKPFEPNELVARVKAHLQRHAAQREQAYRDTLTAAFNRRYFKQRIEQEVHRARTSGDALCVAMLDLDNFKDVNDVHGHSAGDMALQGVVERTLSTLRKPDIVARYGGDEIAIILIRTKLLDAERVMERLVSAVRNQTFALRSGQTLPITISAGVAQLLPREEPEQLIDRADAALYEAKRGGRDRLVVARGGPSSAFGERETVSSG